VLKEDIIKQIFSTSVFQEAHKKDTFLDSKNNAPF